MEDKTSIRPGPKTPKGYCLIAVDLGSIISHGLGLEV